MQKLVNKMARELHVKPLKMLFLSIFVLDFTVGILDFYLMIKLTLLAILGCILTLLINLPLKSLFKTKRPRMDKYQNMEYGFPSFHTQAAFTIVTIYSFYVSYLFFPTFFYATFVGISRLMTKAHKFVDVLFGGISGVLVGIAILLV